MSWPPRPWKPTWCRRSRVRSVPAASSVNVTVVSMLPPAQDQTIRAGGSSSSTRQRTVPSKPGAGLVRRVNSCPTSGTKSLGISQAASASLDVSAAQTRSGG